MTSDPSQGAKDDPSDEADPADSHSGEGLASVRPRLARTLADSEMRTASRQFDAMASCTPLEVPPQADTAGAPNPKPQ